LRKYRPGRVREIFILYYGIRDARTPWLAKAVALAAMVYLISPFDLVPDFIPVAGYLDDLIIVPLLLHLAYRFLPAEVKASGEKKAAKHMVALRIALLAIILLFAALVVGIYYWMKSFHFWMLCLLLATGLVIHAQPVGPFKPGMVIARVVCKAEPEQSYALYIPATGNDKPLPVIYLFDPHGDGKLPVVKYRRLAEQYGFILIGSNNSKNGNDGATTEHIWHRLFEDTRDRLKIFPDCIYACGFSGGAKVAGYIALHDSRVKSVIAGGAGLPDGLPVATLLFSFTGIAGEGDMNLTEMLGLNDEMQRTRTRHRLLFFDGKHEWAPESTMGIAFGGLRLDAMQVASAPADKDLIGKFAAAGERRVNAYMQANQLVRAWRECQAMISFLDGLTGQVAWFQEKSGTLSANTVFKQQSQAQAELLAREGNVKAEYMRQFRDGDVNYWTKTIRDLRTKAAVQNAEKGMNQRLLAYLSLAFYSISNQLINANDPGARHFADLYKLADPDNPEAWYLSAVLDARSNQGSLAENELLKAAKLGFRDKARMRDQPEFGQTAVKINFVRIEDAMK
jgi:uncharacterized membrane protein YkvA (DUF1232 family)